MNTGEPVPPQSEQAEPTSFGELLRHHRQAAGISQEVLAERAGLSAKGLSALENGRRQAPYRHTVTLLARALRLSAADAATLEAAVVRSRQLNSTNAPATVPAPVLADPNMTLLPDTAPGHLARTNLPVQVTSFIGREREQEAVRALLRRARLVTLTGSGGVGKTRLALAVAEGLVADYPDGVWLVELAALTDPALVPQAVAQVFGLREEAGRTALQTVCDALHDRQLLLVLDNCEHLVAACAELASALLRACAALHLLATSREGLQGAGERTYRVPSLSAPDPKHPPAVELVGSYEAVRLFVERAQERRDDFTLTEDTARAVAELCGRLEGVPLAIELAAARMGSIRVETIVQRLDDRLRLLNSGARDLPSRQRTLRAALDWSWDLLTEEERMLLVRLSVFAGGWTLAAAEAVCAGEGQAAWAVLDALDGLVTKSLVQLDERDEQQGRYRLLETVRQYAAERLAAAGVEAAARDRHLAYLLALAEDAEPRLRGPEQGSWLDRLEVEHDNLRAALGWSIRLDGDRAAGLRLAGALWRFWQVRGDFGEGRSWLEAALTAGGQALDLPRARALHAAGVLAFQQGDYERAVVLYEETLALFRRLGDTQGIAASLNNLGNVACRRGDYGRAALLHQEALELRRALGDRGGIAHSLHNLGLVAWEQGDHARATVLYEEALALRRALEDTLAIATTLNNLGIVAKDQGDYGRAATLYEEALAVRRTLGDKLGIASTLGNLGIVARDQGDLARAAALYEESLTLLRALGDLRGIAIGLGNLGDLARDQGDNGRAVTLYEEGLAVRRALGDSRGIAGALGNLANVARDRGDLARAVTLHEESLALLRVLGVKQDIAQALIELGLVLHDQGEQGRAAALLDESLQLSREIGARGVGADALEIVSWVSAAREQPGRAARLGGAAESLREVLGLPLRPYRRAGHGQAVGSMRVALGDAAFAAAWAAGRALPMDDAIGMALADIKNVTPLSTCEAPASATTSRITPFGT